MALRAASRRIASGCAQFSSSRLSSASAAELDSGAGSGMYAAGTVTRRPEKAGEGEESSRNWKLLGGSAALLATGAGSLLVRESRSEGTQEIEVREGDSAASVPLDGKKTKFILGASYRKRVFFNYEQRMRMLSPPEKVFEYFSSVKNAEGQSFFMTPGDLMRAVVPVFPPSESTYIREGHLSGERPPGELFCPPSPFFMLFDTNGDGLISFPEYIFFVTLLSIPERNFKTAFKMFDLDGNGTIERSEFKKVMGVMRSRHRQGVAQRDGRRTGLAVPDSVENGGLVELFFGPDGTARLKHEDFEGFLRELHDEIVRLEFAHYDFKQTGTISARDFALSLVASADLTSLKTFLDRVDAMAYNPRFENVRVTPEEFQKFAELRKKLPTLSVALDSFGKCHGLLTKKDFQRASSQVCNVPVSDVLVDIIYHVFDLNNDGNLSTEEFVKVLHRRQTYIANPTEIGLMNIFKCWRTCASACGTPWGELWAESTA